MKTFQSNFKSFILSLLVFLPALIFASTSGGGEGQISEKEEVDAYIKHHILDSHDFHLFSYTNDAGERKHVGFPLPVIVWTSNGLVTFMSSEFHHDDSGKVIVDKNGTKLTKIHSKIYELDAGAANVVFDETEHATNAHKVLDFSITKSVIGVLFVGLLMLLWFSKLARQYKNHQIPKGFRMYLYIYEKYMLDKTAIYFPPK